MVEVFKPRENMVLHQELMIWFCYQKNGKQLVCDGGPSVISIVDGYWEFYHEGIGYHRLDGPATSEGDWFMFGRCVTPEIHEFAKENSIDLENLTDADKVMIALKFG